MAIPLLSRITRRNAPPAAAPKMFPPDPARISRYDRYDDLWRGNHAAVFDGEWVSRYKSHVISNIPSNIVSISADLLFGEELELQFDDDADEATQEQVRKIWTRNDMRLQLYEAAVDSARCGDAVFSVERDMEGLAKIRSLSARTWFPTLNPDDVRDVLRHEIMWKREAGPDKCYLRVIRHEKGTIYNELFVLRGAEVGAPAPDAAWEALYPDGRPEPEIDTGIDDFLVVHVPNTRSISEYMGRADFAGIEPLFEAVDARLTQGNAILSRHANPILGLPEPVFNSAKGQSALGLRVSAHVTASGEPGIDPQKLEVVSMGPGGEAPQYITWDGRTEDILAYVDKCVEQIALVSETAPQLLNMGDWGPNISGRALKILLLRTLAKVNRKRRYYEVGINKLMELSQLIEGIDEPVTFSIKWPDGLPQDISEAVETEARKLEVGIQSKIGAIQSVDDVDEAAARSKLDDIQAEDDAPRNNAGVQNAIQGNRQPIPVSLNLGRQQE